MKIVLQSDLWKKFSKYHMFRRLLVLFCLIVSALIMSPSSQAAHKPEPWWNIQSVDTMKYSRDLAREKLGDTSFDLVIDTEVRKIAGTGATHVAIGTPYDSEFIPMLRRWIRAARKYNLHVWFRGNVSGWEGWFGYQRIGREEHTKLITEFIYNNPDLFADGDLFTSCTECENGGPGDPRFTGDVKGFRSFIISEYNAVKEAFSKINRDVQANLYSYNGDVARLVMDEQTTKSLDGIVVIDHYVKDPAKMVRDIDDLSGRSGGKIVVGEFGAPVPDIHGTMTPLEQAKWLDTTLALLSRSPNVAGINYWVATGGSTKLWNENGNPMPAVAILQKYYSPKKVSGVVTDELQYPVRAATIKTQFRETKTDSNGAFTLNILDGETIATVSAEAHNPVTTNLPYSEDAYKIVLMPEHETFIYKIRKLLIRILTGIL